MNATALNTNFDLQLVKPCNFFLFKHNVSLFYNIANKLNFITFDVEGLIKAANEKGKDLIYINGQTGVFYTFYILNNEVTFTKYELNELCFEKINRPVDGFYETGFEYEFLFFSEIECY